MGKALENSLKYGIIKIKLFIYAHLTIASVRYVEWDKENIKQWSIGPDQKIFLRR